MTTEKTTGVDDLHVESADPGISHYQDVDIHDKVLNNNALEATVEEHNIGLFQAFKTYKRAAFWSVCKCSKEVSLCGAIEIDKLPK